MKNLSLVSLSICVVGMTSRLAPMKAATRNGISKSRLSAMPKSNPSAWGSRGFPSKTARESAFNVEWEPMTELERRIEDGINYEHIPEHGQHRGATSQSHRFIDEAEEVVSAHGVFVGYRYTQDEYDRLKSAHVSQ